MPEITPEVGHNEGVDLGAAFDAHMKAEFEDQSLDGTMDTMGASPMVMHLPTTAGGRGADAVAAFYRDRFIFCSPDDIEITEVSRTVGADQLVDEIHVRFTHDREMPIFLPRVEPTGRQIEINMVVVVGFLTGSVVFERIYWDQASVLVQVGLLEESRYALGSVEARRVMSGSPVDPLA